MSERDVAELTRLVGLTVQGINDLRGDVQEVKQKVEIIEQKVDSLQNELTRFRTEVNQRLDKIEKRLDAIEYQMKVMHSDIYEVRGKQAHLEDRVGKIEEKLSDRAA